MTYDTSKSKALFERATRVMIEGGSSPSRGPANYGAYPLFIDRASGSRVWDADGNEYIDWMMAYGALPLGHAHPRVVQAVAEAATTGTLFAAATEIVALTKRGLSCASPSWVTSPTRMPLNSTPAPTRSPGTGPWNCT